ncbi:MAG: hypothetical protein ACE5LC_00780 [Candidatus Aminicenantales bacterium]
MKGQGNSSPKKEEVRISGELLQIFGLGVLITGDSGIGKSECALELISRNHRLISDDVVEVKRDAEGHLIGTAPRLSRNFMEIRGLGIINIKEVFGPKVLLKQTKINLAIELKRWRKGKEYDRIGLKYPHDVEILGQKVPRFIIPVAPGRNTATLVEVACRVYILREKGYKASTEIIKRLNRALQVQ